MEPDHQPPAPAERLDQGQRLPVEIAPATRGDHQQAAAANPQLQAANLLYALAWMPSAGIRASALQTLLAIGSGHHTPKEICDATGLTANGVWCALRTLRGFSRSHVSTTDRGPRNPPLIGRQVDPHAGRCNTYRYGTTEEGDLLLAWLTDPTTVAPPISSIPRPKRKTANGDEGE